MNLRQLYYFRTLAKLEHYTQAAAHLCITQPSLSHAISELEKGEKMQKFTSPTHGVIDLTFIYTLGPRFVPNIIQAFSNEEQYKNITFSFSQGVTSQIIQGLKEEKYDLAFCSMLEDEPDIEFTLIAEQELVVIVPQDHPLASKDSIPLKETALTHLCSFLKKAAYVPLSISCSWKKTSNRKLNVK